MSKKAKCFLNNLLFISLFSIFLFTSCSCELNKEADGEITQVTYQQKASDKDYRDYYWRAELSKAQYNVERSKYTVVISNIPNTSGSESPLVGEFYEGELKAFYGNLYSRFGDCYYSYNDFGDYIYISVIREITNAEKFVTEEYLNNDDFAINKLKEIRGDNFEWYDPNLTLYKKNEYLLVDDTLFLLDHERQILIEQDKEKNYDYEEMVIEKNRIIDMPLVE